MFSGSRLLPRQTQQESTFEMLFHHHYQRVYNILFRLLGEQSEAEDMTQQVFLKLYHAPSHLKNDEATNIAGWLYRVAVNEGYNALRRRKRHQRWQEKRMRLWPFESSEADPAQTLEMAERQAQVRQILALMKPRDAKLLLLRHSGLSYKEIAHVLNVAPGSIGSLLTRAERAFRLKYCQLFSEKE